MNELTEKVEEAAHEGHGHGRLGTFIGVTIATLGVLLALCSALVGAQRTELIATMVEQSNANTKYQALSTRHRVLFAQLQQLHALSPDSKKFKLLNEQSLKLLSEIKTPDIAKLATLIRVENAKNLEAEIPSRSDLTRFTSILRRLEKENHAAREWTEAFEPAISAHSEAAERFELAQLAAEIGIVLASIALLFMNRLAWLGSIGLVIATIVIAAMTLFATASELKHAEHKLEESKKHFDAFKSDAEGKAADDAFLKSVDEEPAPNIEP